MPNFSQSDFEIEFAEHSVFDGKRYVQYLRNLQLCEKRTIPSNVENDQKIIKSEPHRLTVLSCQNHSTVSVTINNETPVNFVLYPNDTFVIPSCDCPVVVKCDKESTLVAFSLLETMECHRFMNSKFRLYWPILGTTKYFESIYQNIWIHDVSEHSDFLDKFVFSNFSNDAPIFKFLRKQLDFTTIKYSPLSLYIELSKWRSFPKRIYIDDHTDSDVKVVLYSENDESLTQLTQDIKFQEFLQFPLANEINLTSPRCVEFHVSNSSWENCKTFLQTHYKSLIQHCVITEKENQILETQHIESSAHVYTKKVQFALDQFQENNLIYPVLCEPDEVPKEYQWSKKVWDIVFMNTSGYEHIKI